MVVLVDHVSDPHQIQCSLDLLESVLPELNDFVLRTISFHPGDANPFVRILNDFGEEMFNWIHW